MVAVSERRRAVIGLAQRVDVGRAAQGADRRTFDPHRGQRAVHPAQHRGQRLLAAFRHVGRLRQQLEVAQELVRALRLERGGVDHHEILRGPLRTRQPLTRDVQHLHRQPARQRDRIVQDIARIGRQAQEHLVLARRREQPLRQFGRQVGVDGQRALDDPVRLGMDRAHGMAVILRGRIQDRVERLVQLADHVGLVRLHVLDGGGVTDGRLHGGSPEIAGETHVSPTPFRARRTYTAVRPYSCLVTGWLDDSPPSTAIAWPLT